VTVGNDKATFFEELAEVQAKCNYLPEASLLRQALCDGILDQVARKVQETPVAELSFAFWPYLYGLFAIHSIEAIAALDADVCTVVEHSNSDKVADIKRFLRTSEGKRHGDWFGGLFDVWIKSIACRSGLPVEFDRPLSNGRDNDICLQMNGRRFHIEGTAFTTDDETDEVWKRYCTDLRDDPSTILTRPGRYCPPNAKGPSLYYETLRFYAKVFDKLAKDLDPTRSQFADDAPNLLFVSFSGQGVGSDRPSVGWALDELFAAQPRSTPRNEQSSVPDITMYGWIDFRAKELMRNNKMQPQWYCDHSHEVIAAPRRLGGILLFDGCRLMRSRVNYNSNAECSITHREIADIERLFNWQTPYWM